VPVPVNGDFRDGFATEPAGVGANVALEVKTGLAGVSIEDSTGDPSRPLFDFPLPVERIRAARGAIDASGSGVLLTGRSEGFIAGRPDPGS
jgi:methylisocitrate lyase